MTRREPLAVQFVRQLLPSIDPALLADPGSRQLRAAVSHAAAAAGWPLTPTRRELAQAVRQLAAAEGR